MHHDITYENYQQNAAVWDNLSFLGCCTCFEGYFRSSSGAAKLHYNFWYYTRMLLPAGIIGELVRSSRSTRSCKYSLDAPDDERKYRSKHVAQPRNNIILHSCILLVIFVKYIMMHGTTNIKSLEYLLILDPLEMFRSL